MRAKIDFARFLSIWLFELHMDETLFWRTMNPARLHALYSAHFDRRPHGSTATGGSGSLSQYLMGGG